ncbi:hypothetical protein [Piscinibacter sakaiensis]|uniref:hypothetical protein n=1 Tax=Piscinibacter sakaiensis TaxID=1547922 RepID=UPI003AAE07B6
MRLAELVQTGRAECEFQQSIVVEPDSRQPGAFRVSFQRKTYRMVPEETSTGAVRLYDADAGVAWLQIPMKSMLMNTRAGQRMVDACTSPTQRMVQAEAQAAERMRPAGQLATPVLLVDPATAAAQAAAAPGQAASEPIAAGAAGGDASATPAQAPAVAVDTANPAAVSTAATQPAAAPASPAASSALSGDVAAVPDKPSEAPPRN